MRKILTGIMVIAAVSTLSLVKADAAWKYTSDNSWKYEENGVNVTGWKMINNLWYNFGTDGTMQTGWIKGSNNDWYYCWSDGSMAQNSWLTNGGFWYYFDDNGKLVTDKAKVGDNTYYFNVPAIIASTDLGIKFNEANMPGNDLTEDLNSSENISE